MTNDELTSLLNSCDKYEDLLLLLETNIKIDIKNYFELFNITNIEDEYLELYYKYEYFGYIFNYTEIKLIEKPNIIKYLETNYDKYNEENNIFINNSYNNLQKFIYENYNYDINIETDEINKYFYKNVYPGHNYIEDLKIIPNENLNTFINRIKNATIINYKIFSNMYLHYLNKELKIDYKLVNTTIFKFNLFNNKYNFNQIINIFNPLYLSEDNILNNFSIISNEDNNETMIEYVYNYYNEKSIYNEYIPEYIYLILYEYKVKLTKSIIDYYLKITDNCETFLNYIHNIGQINFKIINNLYYDKYNKIVPDELKDLDYTVLTYSELKNYIITKNIYEFNYLVFDLWNKDNEFFYNSINNDNSKIKNTRIDLLLKLKYLYMNNSDVIEIGLKNGLIYKKKPLTILKINKYINKFDKIIDFIDFLSNLIITKKTFEKLYYKFYKINNIFVNNNYTYKYIFHCLETMSAQDFDKKFISDNLNLNINLDIDINQQFGNLL